MFGSRWIVGFSVPSRLKLLTIGMCQRRISWADTGSRAPRRAAREERPVSCPGSDRHRAGGRGADDYDLHGSRDAFVNRHIQRLRQQLAGWSSGRERPGGGHEHRIGEGARPEAKRGIVQSGETRTTSRTTAVRKRKHVPRKRSRLFMRSARTMQCIAKMR